jgi:hypothetical protein
LDASGRRRPVVLGFAVLSRELLADRHQLSPALRSRLGVSHFQLLKSIKDNLRYDQPGAFPVIGRYNVPWRAVSACGAKTPAMHFHVALPELPCRNIGEAELPVPLRLVDALQKPLSLLLLGKVEKELDDAAGSIGVKPHQKGN